MKPNRRSLLALALGCAAGLRAAHAMRAPPELAALLPGARLVGSGRLRFLGLRVYEARLWAAGGALAGEWTSVPLALEIEYARDIEGAQIAERTMAEMRRLTGLDAAVAERWLLAMRQSFPDVKAGDRLTGLHRPGLGVRFFHNGEPRGEVAGADFGPLFLGIWLSPRTSEPALRDALLGRGS